jgi:acyl dehydratase
VAGETVWSSRSTYLRRGKGGGEKKAASELEPQRGTVSQVRVSPGVAKKYAAISGDRNPIHVSTLGAKAFGFPSVIAHGMWLQARSLANLEGRLPQSYRVDVAFKTPVLLPSVIAMATASTDTGWELDVRSVKSGKPHLSGNVITL